MAYNIKLKHIQPIEYHNASLFVNANVYTYPIQWWFGRSELQDEWYQLDGRNQPNSSYAEITIDRYNRGEYYKVKYVEIECSSLTDTILTLQPEGWEERSHRSVNSRYNKVELDQISQEAYFNIRIETTDESLIPDNEVILIRMGVYEEYNKEDINNIIYNYDSNITGLDYPISSMEINMNKKILDYSINSFWELYIQRNNESTSIVPYIFYDIKESENNTYDLIFYDAIYYLKLQEINSNEINTFYNIFRTNCKNEIIYIFSDTNMKYKIGNYYNKNLLLAALQVPIGNNQRLATTGTIYNCYLTGIDNLYTIDTNMTIPTTADVGYECFIGGKLEQQQRLDSVVIFYSEFTQSGNTYTESETSERYDNSESGTITNIKSVKKIQIETTQANRQSLANSLFTYYKYPIYKGKVYSKFPVTSGVYTFETEYGLIKGVILKSKSYISSSSIASEIEMLAMRIV